MQVKTSELSGVTLDWAVAKCETPSGRDNDEIWLRDHRIGFSTRYSRVWSQGGPIIEREGILLRPIRKQGHGMNGKWLAMYDGTNTGSIVQWTKREDFIRHYWIGYTPLIAAMHCYVGSKLGDTIEIPNELMTS